MQIGDHSSGATRRESCRAVGGHERYPRNRLEMEKFPVFQYSQEHGVTIFCNAGVAHDREGRVPTDMMGSILAPGRAVKLAVLIHHRSMLNLAFDQTSHSALAIFVLDSAIDSRHSPRLVVLR